jgi:competence protein ComEC
LNIVGAAACILLIVNPPELFTAGFQLSFAAAFGLVLLYPRVWRLIAVIPIMRIRPVRWVGELLCASLAAQIGTLPLTALYFEKLSFAGVIANLFVVPAAGIVIGLAAFIAIISPVAYLGYLLGDVTRIFVHGIIVSVHWFGELPFAYSNIPPFTTVQACLFYTAVAFLFSAPDWLTIVKRTGILLTGILALLINPYSLHPPFFTPGMLTVAVLDVGQGDGIVAQLPNGNIIVIDAGPATMKQERNLPVPAFLRRQGLTRIHALVLTHLHFDHIGGAPELLKEFSIDTIYHSGERTTGAIPGTLDSLVGVAGIPSKRIVSGDRIYCDSTVRMYVLFPDTTAVSAQGVTSGGNLNNGSIVIKIQYRETSILLSGDLEHPGERLLAVRYGDFLRANILKAGHHGSSTSTTPEYLDGIKPATSFISVGENNFGHPSAAVLDRLHANGITIKRTDTGGAILWESDGTIWRENTWR